MRRLARLDAPGVLHHVMGRGIGKKVFWEDPDRSDFLLRLAALGVISARNDFSRVAVRLLGHGGAGVARYLGVTSSCVTRIASQEGRLEDLEIRYNVG
jgi:hypothetical protein